MQGDNEHRLFSEGWEEEEKLAQSVTGRQNLWKCFRIGYLNIILDRGEETIKEEEILKKRKLDGLREE